MRMLTTKWMDYCRMNQNSIHFGTTPSYLFEKYELRRSLDSAVQMLLNIRSNNIRSVIDENFTTDGHHIRSEYRKNKSSGRKGIVMNNWYRRGRGRGRGRGRIKKKNEKRREEKRRYKATNLLLEALRPLISDIHLIMHAIYLPLSGSA